MKLATFKEKYKNKIINSIENKKGSHSIEIKAFMSNKKQVSWDASVITDDDGNIENFFLIRIHSEKPSDEVKAFNSFTSFLKKLKITYYPCEYLHFILQDENCSLDNFVKNIPVSTININDDISNLMIAAMYNNYNVVEYLLSQDVDLTLYNQEFHEALNVAHRDQSYQVVSVMEKYLLDLEINDDQDFSVGL